MLRLDWCLRMLMAAVCGGIIGFERKSKAKMAGIRTHALIAVGAAMVMIISKYGFFDLLKVTHSNWNVDPSRIAAQVVSGIGFLGAGTIINRHDEIIDGLLQQLEFGLPAQSVLPMVVVYTVLGLLALVAFF